MPVRGEYRDRTEREVAVLDALVDRGREGMTVLEVRSRAAIDIDDVERALAALKEDGLIDVEKEGGQTVIRPVERVIPDPEHEEGDDLVDRMRDRFPF
jgi:Sugar-specific transcriptional regulator TrmB.